MTMKFNTTPYFDDFDPAKNFYRVLFKPGVAVQARELNQLQSILQHQVSSVGNHIFKKNAMVIPGGVSLNNGADIVFISGIEDAAPLVGKTITNAVTFDPTDASTLLDSIVAVVLGYKNSTETEPAALYIKYTQTQPQTNVTAARSLFDPSEELRTVGQELIIFRVDSTKGASKGKVATINQGTFYTKELFVDCITQSVIIETDNATTTNCTVGLRVSEEIVTSDDDLSLLDNASGSPNEFAPGADRYKVKLTLVRVDGNITDEENFITMMVIKNNVITYVNDKTQYGELMKTLARRTYDANGNFIVNGLDTSITSSSDGNYVWLNITSGKCYLGGYEYEQITPTPISIKKPRDSEFQETVPVINTYTSGFPYFYVAGSNLAKEVPSQDSLIQILNASPGTANAKVIGYGVFKHIQSANIGTVNTGTDVYRAYIDYLSLDRGYTYSDIGGIKATATANLAEGLPVLHEVNVTGVTGTFGTGNIIVSTAGGSETGTVYAVQGRNLYVRKHTLNRLPDFDTITDITTNATGNLASTFVTNYNDNFTPMIEVDKDVIKTLFTYNPSSDDFTNKTQYSIVNRNSFVNLAQGETFSPTLTNPNEIYDNFSPSNYFGFIINSGSEQFVDLTGIISVEGVRYKLTVPVGSTLIGKTLVVFSTIIKSQALESSKVLTVGTTIVPTPSASWMTLDHQDVLNIIKIVESDTVTVMGTSWNSGTGRITYTLRSNSPITIASNDVVIPQQIASVNNTTGAFNTGANKQVTVLPGSVTVGTTNVGGVVFNTATFTSLETFTNPGAYQSGGIVALAPNLNTNVDITSRFNMFSGNTVNLSGVGMVKLRKNATIPVGQLAIQYNYYQLGAGNYVSVDSYGSHLSEDLSYIGQIPNILTNDNTFIESRRMIDMRTRPSHYFIRNIGIIQSGSSNLLLRDLNLSARCDCLQGKYVVGPSHPTGVLINSVVYDENTGNSILQLATAASETTSGRYFIGLNGTGLSLVDENAGGRRYTFPKDEARMSYQCTKFKEKQVMVFVKRDSDVLEVDFEEVSSLREMYALSRNEFKLPLAHARLNPYTVTIRDITLTKFENPVYKMLDIHEIKRRLDRNDYFTSLSLNRDIEGEIEEYEEEQSLGVPSRGFWNENFARPLLQDFEDNDFKSTIYDRSYAAPGTVTRTIELELNTDLNQNTWQQTGTSITLPYTEKRAFGNPLASKSNNLNPFNIVNWVGKMVLNPSVDNWVDVTSSPEPSVNNTAQIGIDQSIAQEVAVQVELPPPPPPLPPPPIVAADPPVVLPPPPIVEIVIQINNLRTSWSRDSWGGSHAITFDWVTNLNRRGRVNTDIHLSPAVRQRGHNGVFARSLINRRYNDADVREYLNAGTHFDQKAPSAWR